jgi:hypothetical protein
MTMKIIIEPTQEIEEIQVPRFSLAGDVEARLWQGKTDSGIEVEAFVLVFVPKHKEDYERLKAEMPDFMTKWSDRF